MAWDDVVADGGRGPLEFCLLIEGIPYLFVTSTNVTWTLPGVTGSFTQLSGTLQRKGLEWSYRVNAKQGDLEHPAITFHLTDADDADTRQRITELLSGVARANATELRETITSTEAAVVKVETVAAFNGSGGDIYVDLETIGYTTLDSAATPDEFEGAPLVRGKYGSPTTEHIYQPDPDNERVVGDLVPEVSDRPITWYGRHCRLYVAELETDKNGTFVLSGAATVKWKGRLLGAIELGSDGLSWSVPTESVWAALDTSIPLREHKAELRGIAFNEMNQYMTIIGGDSDPVEVLNGTFTFKDANTFMTHLAGRLQVAVNDDTVLAADNTRVLWNPGTSSLFLTSDGVHRHVGFTAGHFILIAMGIGVRPYGIENFALSTEEPTHLRPVQAAIFMRRGGGSVTVTVSDGTEFAAVNVEDATTGVQIRTYVELGLGQLGGGRYYLDAVSGDTLTLSLDLDTAVLVQGYNDPATELRMALALEGDWQHAWKLLIESATVPSAWKGFLRSDLFDWTAIQEAAERAVSGEANKRFRLLVEPVSFREMFMEDIAWGGLLPTVEDGAISATPLQQPLELAPVLALSHSNILEGTKPKVAFSVDRVINQLAFHWQRDMWEGGEWQGPPAIVNERRSQQRYGHVNKREISNRGTLWARARSDADRIALVPFAAAQVFLQLYGYDYPVIAIDCDLSAGNLQIGDSVTLTHYLVPDYAGGVRGTVDLACFVIGVKVSPERAMVSLDLQQGDGLRRSGFAPAARVEAYTLDGSDHELTVVTGVYATAQNEGLYFTVGDKVLLQEWDNDSPIADEAFTILAISVDGKTITIDAAPSGAMQALMTAASTKVALVFDEYDTASQTASAQSYLHIADEDDGLIGASGERGFHLA